MSTIPTVILAVLLLLELLWSRTRGQQVHNLPDTAANLAIAIVNGLIRPAALAWTYVILSLIEPYQLFRLEGSIPIYILTFLVAELAYYWYHRLSHEAPLLWTLHHTHHSSLQFNFSTAVRLNWIAKFVSPLFFAPLVLLGLSPTWIAVSLGLGLAYQLFLHTEAIPALGWFEGKLLNTPSAHRVHHGRNPSYIDKNYGSALIIWDRLFGTYQAETEPVSYGVTTGFVGNNPLVIQLAPLLRLLRGELKRERDSARLGATPTLGASLGAPVGSHHGTHPELQPPWCNIGHRQSDHAA